ncbi:hypothetical protein SCP_1102670 [Sparassis crispa]|uniref:NAD(P)-binding protein n=1 Tax=Sparassis crispa TaxID=139825 RepID=A0A401GZK7_9APHY|nr:hypothetical protein SCP_1102670 [Sparassis crispa]GBE87590.1 hypothetical protein SCP_1102670 [Sparassis crispa]
MSTTRIAVVMGASQGIGDALALRLEDDGFDVAVNDIPSLAESLKAVVEKIQQKGRHFLIVTGDVSNENDVKTVVDKVVETLASVKEYDRVMSVNAKGVFLSFKYAALQMIKQGRGGSIIGACSMAGKMGESAEHPPTKTPAFMSTLHDQGCPIFLYTSHQNSQCGDLPKLAVHLDLLVLTEKDS